MEPFSVLVKCSDVLYSTADSMLLAKSIRNALLDIHRIDENTTTNCAEEALLSASSSAEPGPYVRDAINELKRVYFLYEELLQQTVNHRILVVFQDKKDLIEDKDALHSRLLELAAVICKHHVDIRERDNATRFMKLALPAHLAGHVVFRTRDLTPEALRDDSTLVHTYVQETKGRSMNGTPIWHMNTRFKLTDEGEAYVRQRTADVRQEVLTAFKNMGLEPNLE
jgi:hypothetical protein